jgi:hypothetical protein
MADGISTRTQRLTREQIAELVGNNPRAIRLFENLLADVAGTLPDAIVESELSARYSLQAADGSKSNSFNALRLGEEIEILMMTIRSQASQITALRQSVEALEASILSGKSQASQLVALRREVDDLRALAQGV